ncbi:hypothetical protein OF83DRAFT_1139545 [Amylostereum chailletii]|nr:hypothetical protein OF83DRAFT_1139545 [Amylostereum chailletii]
MPAQGHGGQRMSAQRTDSGYAYSDQFPVQVHQQAAHSTAGARIASSSSVHGVVQGTGGGGSSNSHPSRAEVPKCRVPDCPLEIFYDTHGKEWSDYCGDAHVLEAVARGLSPRCYHCLARPCRSGDYYCGKICREAAAAKRL